MAKLLQNSKNIPLNFTSRTILVLKPPPEESIQRGQFYNLAFDLKLFNATDDNFLHISFSTTRITFKDYAFRSLGDGWGKEQSVDMNFNQSVMYGDTVSIHHYLTDSDFGQYQILLNGITIYHFNQLLPGPATKISYAHCSYINDDGSKGYKIYWGPSYWGVHVYQISDLLPDDQLALVSGR